MEIIRCYDVKFDVPNLVPFTYVGPEFTFFLVKYVGPDIPVLIQNVPQLSELITIGTQYYYSFNFNADKNTSYATKLRSLN